LLGGLCANDQRKRGDVVSADKPASGAERKAMPTDLTAKVGRKRAAVPAERRVASTRADRPTQWQGKEAKPGSP
jgi:hypothetical protein